MVIHSLLRKAPNGITEIRKKVAKADDARVVESGRERAIHRQVLNLAPNPNLNLSPSAGVIKIRSKITIKSQKLTAASSGTREENKDGQSEIGQYSSVTFPA